MKGRSMTNTTPDTNIQYLSEEGLATLEKLYPDMPPAERELFARQCDRTQLDPLGRQIYSVKRKSKGVERWATQVSIDGFRVIAQRTGEYEGQSGPHWCGADSVWVDVWVKPEPPLAARVGIFRRGFREPLYSIARYDGYVGKDFNGNVTDIWAKMPELMTAKCAEALGLRRAFPQELSGLYTSEEMTQADNPTENPRAKAPAPAADANLEQKLAASVAANAASAQAVAKTTPPPPVSTTVENPIATEATSTEGLPTIPQDYEIGKMKESIQACTKPEEMTAILPRVMQITDPVIKTAVQAIFKAHREAKGWNTARNSQGVAGVVA